MKLISMTSFIEHIGNRYEHESYNQDLGLIYNYCNFLKQPLKLEMFVPCDDEGNVLEECVLTTDTAVTEIKKVEYYYQAKEKVLFEGCSISKLMRENYYQVYCNSDRILWLSWNKSKTIEDLILANLTLTESAKKQIGI